MTEDWLTEIAVDIPPESLPEAYQEVALVIGMERTLKLAHYLGGMSFYFPKLDAVIQRKRDERIRLEFTGSNHRELARKYGLSDRWIREIVQTRPNETPAKQGDIQLSLL
jgi:Mor family transcriptional regulator